MNNLGANVVLNTLSKNKISHKNNLSIGAKKFLDFRSKSKSKGKHTILF